MRYWSSYVCSSDHGLRRRRLVGGRAQPLWRACARRRLCEVGTRSAGDGIHAAHHARAVDGHLVEPGESCGLQGRSEEHTSELQSLMRISSAVFCLKKKKSKTRNN